MACYRRGHRLCPASANLNFELSEALAATIPPPWAVGAAAAKGAEAEKLRMLHVRQAVACDPHHPDANNALARWLAVNGNTDDAARHYAAAGTQSDTAGVQLPCIAHSSEAGAPRTT